MCNEVRHGDMIGGEGLYEERFRTLSQYKVISAIIQEANLYTTGSIKMSKEVYEREINSVKMHLLSVQEKRIRLEMISRFVKDSEVAITHNNYQTCGEQIWGRSVKFSQLYFSISRDMRHLVDNHSDGHTYNEYVKLTRRLHLSDTDFLRSRYIKIRSIGEIMSRLAKRLPGSLRGAINKFSRTGNPIDHFMDDAVNGNSDD